MGQPGRDAETFLRSTLAIGPVSATEILERADVLLIAERTLRRAKARLRVTSVRSGQDQQWYWCPPGDRDLIW